MVVRIASEQRRKNTGIIIRVLVSLAVAIVLCLGIASPAEAVWFSETCHTGPRYKVRVDQETGKVVQVPIDLQDDFYFGGDNEQQQQQQQQNDTVLDDNLDFGLGSNTYRDDDDDANKNRHNKRVLRSDRIWRDLGESQTDALVVKSNQEDDDSSPDRASYTTRFLETLQQLDQASESLNPRRWLQSSNKNNDYNDYNELKEGEFFVKPCLCKMSRWTFPDNEPDFMQTAGMNSSSDRRNSNSNRNELDHTELIKNPKNFALMEDGLYYVPPGETWHDTYEDLDLYLCNTQAILCGIPQKDSGMPAKCYEHNMRHIIARNAWPLILLWYAGLTIICCCTVHGRTASDYVTDRLVYFFKKCLCCFGEIEYDFNDRMLNRMMEDDQRETRRQSRHGSSTDDEDAVTRPWFFSNQRQIFERSLLAQVQWIWRHQEYLREQERREQGLPPPQIKLKVKKFCMETTTSGSNGCGFLQTKTKTKTTNAEDTLLKATTKSVPPTRPPPSPGTIPAITYLKKRNEEQQNEFRESSLHKKTTEHSNSNSNSDLSPNIITCTEEEDDAEVVTLDLGPQENNNDNNSNDDENENHDEEEEHICRPCHDYNDDDADDADSLEVPMCTICFCPFEEGDKIGDLACRHEFHVECLKGWVQRKNACPLCNTRLGRPERPMEDDTTNSQDYLDASRHSISSLMQRIGSLRRNQHRVNGEPQPPSGGGEIERRSRVGMIGSVSAAEDIVAARPRLR